MKKVSKTKPALHQLRWKKVEVPRAWRPQPGEELLGYYGGRSIRNGSFGQYDVVLVHVPYKGSFLVSGTMLIQLVDAAMLLKGSPVRILFKGNMPLGGDKELKQFELWVPDGTGLSETDLPEVRLS